MSVLVFHQRNRAGILVFHPGKLPEITGVLWKRLSGALEAIRLGYPRKRGLSGASWNRQGTILGKQRRLEDYSTS